MKLLWRQKLPDHCYCEPVPTPGGLLLALSGPKTRLAFQATMAPLAPLETVLELDARFDLLHLDADHLLLSTSTGILIYEHATRVTRALPVGGLDGKITSCAVTPDGSSIAATHCLDASAECHCYDRDGRSLWHQVIDPGTRLHCVDDDHLLAYTGLALSLIDWRTGAVLRRASLTKGNRPGMIATHGDRLYARTGIWLEVLDRHSLSHIATLEPGFGYSTPLSVGHRLFLIQNKTALALDHLSLGSLWQTQLGDPCTSVASGRPLHHRGRLYFGAHDGSVTCIDADSGAILSRHEVGDIINLRPVQIDQRIYVVSNHPQLHCFDLSQPADAVLVQRPLPCLDLGGYHQIRGALADGHLLVTLDSEWLWIRDGLIRRRLVVPGGADPHPVGNDIYFTFGNESRLMCLYNGEDRAVEVTVPPGRDPLYRTFSGFWLYLCWFRQDVAGERRACWAPVDLQSGAATDWGLPVYRNLGWQGRTCEEVVFLAADGTTRVVQSEEGADEVPSHPALSPDRRTLAFTLGGYELGSWICLYDLATNALRRFPLGEAWEQSAPVWLDEQNLIAATSDGACQTFYKVNLAGTVTEVVHHQGEILTAWTVVDGKTLAFTHNLRELVLWPLSSLE